MRALRAALERAAATGTTVLLTGESGVGKGVAARCLHGLSCPDAPFVTVDCSALPSSPAEVEALVFGREGTASLLDGAAEGTLFLDEVAELAPPLQARLLGVVEGRSYLPVGAVEPLRLGARIVAASNADLAGRVASGAFREDLLFRLSVVELPVPPLRDRPEDLTDLAAYFLEHLSRAAGGTPKRFAEDAVDVLLSHRWPGNVRELRNRIERAVVLAPEDDISRADLFPDPRPKPGIRPDPAAPGAEQPIAALPEDGEEPASLAEAREAAEREHIRRVIARCGGRVGDAARALGVSRTTLWDRMRRLGLPSR